MPAVEDNMRPEDALMLAQTAGIALQIGLDLEKRIGTGKNIAADSSMQLADIKPALLGKVGNYHCIDKITVIGIITGDKP